MYKLDIFRFPTSTEYEYKFAGNYGAKGEKRSPRSKRTPEEIAKQNQYQRRKTVRHLIKANFKENDFWITLRYQKGETKDIDEITKDVSRFLAQMRYQYKKTGTPCKYIYRIEIGSKGGIHVHMVMNRIPDLDVIIKKCWIHGWTHHELLDDGTYEDLADYIVKLPNDEQKKQIKVHGSDPKRLIKYSCSRNLKRPVPETKEFSRRTMHQIFNHDLVPEQGYYIDKNSIRRGVNAFTGTGYLYYQEIRLKTEQRADPVRIYECPICHQFTIDSIKCDCQRKQHGQHISRKYNQAAKKRRSVRNMDSRICSGQGSEQVCHASGRV